VSENLLLPSGEPIIIDIFRPTDADGVARLFREVYGEGYPVKSVYDPNMLIAAFQNQENVPVVARKAAGEIIGTLSLCRSTPNPCLYEAGQGLVLPAYRGFGISSAVNSHLMNVVGPTLNLEAAFSESACNHVNMQVTTANLGFVETGLEVDLMPQEAYGREGVHPGRVSVLPQFRLYRPGKAVTFVPEQYGEWLRFLYEGLADRGTLVPATVTAQREGTSEIKSQVFEFARVVRVAVLHAGRDFEEVFAGEEEEFLFAGMLVHQVWLRLSVPSVAATVEYLRGLGYFFGGLLLRWFGDDALLMQRIVGKPNWEGITLYTDRAKRILDMVCQDWERSRR
jgi:hypothetical protein